MKHTFAALLIFLTVLMPHAPLFAAGEESKQVNVLEEQLEAVKTYLKNINVSPQKLTNGEMRDIILDGAAWLVVAQEESGHFAYEYAPYDNKYLRGDNIVRQAGALFGLGEVYRRQKESDAQIENSIKQAVKFFENQSQEGQVKGTKFRCVTNTAKSDHCKLGATSLALIGILGYVDGKPEAKDDYKNLVRDYTSYILVAQTEEGGFRDSFRKDEFEDTESPFSNGEALLALVRAYEAKPDAKVKQSIDKAFQYLKVKGYDNNLYLWIMAALKDMQTLWPNPEYVTYARDFTAWRMERAPAINTDHNYCPYTEGLASAYSVLETMPLGGELARLHTELDRLNATHRRLQISDSDFYRVVRNTDGAFRIAQLAEPKLAVGGFLTGNSEPTQRIDFTQHCVSTYAQTLVDIDGQSL